MSIHALREEGDVTVFDVLGDKEEFLSTPSARRATHSQAKRRGCRRISIHALREEGDRHTDAALDLALNISIHALREEGDSKNRDKISIFL